MAIISDDKYPLREVVDMKAMYEKSKAFAHAIRKSDKDWRKENKEEGTMYVGASLVTVAMILFVILTIKSRGG
jgi:hypothetical protein